MHDVERSASSLAEDGKRQPPSTFKAALVALALITIGAGVLLFLAPSGAPDRPFNPAPPLDHSLTDEEAIARFEELLTVSIKAGRERDPSLLEPIYTIDSPMKQRGYQSIRELRRDDVLDLTRVETTSVDVVKNSKNSIDLRVNQIFRPCFKTESGDDVTEGPAVIERTAVWTMSLEQGQWLLHNARLEAEKPRGADHAACP